MARGEADRGAAVFPALPPGGYEVTASLYGFAPVKQSDLVLRVGQSARLVMTLRVEVSETIAVTAEAPIVDVSKTDASTNLTPEQIEELPTANRDFQKRAFIALGVERERGGFRFITGAPAVGSAGNASQATIMVDGVDFTDQTLGLARARFSQDAVREFRVINNRFDVEIGNSNPVRPNPAWTQVNMYTNEGRSEYTPIMASLSGTLSGGHVLTASVTYGDRRSISDDFSPALNADPSDPSDIEADFSSATWPAPIWGRVGEAESRKLRAES